VMSWCGWQSFPDHIFSDLMIIVGRENIGDFQKCRQVCKSWNVMTSQMIKRGKDVIKRTAESLDVQIREKWREEWDFHAPPLTEILTAASLAHQGLLGSVEGLVLEDVDLASVPTELLASLVSCATRSVDILNVRNCDIINILDTLQTLKTLSMGNTAEKYREQMRSWAERIHWEVAEGVMEGFGDQCFIVSRHKIPSGMIQDTATLENLQSS